MMDYSKKLRVLKNQIVITRAKMNEIWNQRGCTDANVLEISVELDCLLNQYQRLTNSKTVQKSKNRQKQLFETRVLAIKGDKQNTGIA